MKPRMINANPETIEELYFKRDWRRIIDLERNIRIPTSNPLSLDSLVHDQADSIWETFARDGIIVHDNDPFLINLQEDPLSVLNTPSDVFFVERNTKKKYLDKAGVLVSARKSASDIDMTICFERILNKGLPFTWQEFFGDINKRIPSNALVIVDRYMFSSFENGIENLKNILDSILPSQMDGEYHVLLIVDDSQIRENRTTLDSDDAAWDIQSVVRELERPYEICLEILMVKSIGEKKAGYRWTLQELAQQTIYNETHDRRIYSNYFVVSADHALSAVRETQNGKNVAIYGQTLRFQSIYSGIKNKYQDLKSLPTKGINDFISALDIFIRSPYPCCRFYRDGQRVDVSSAKNRLLQ